jgi:hypothetical protein
MGMKFGLPECTMRVSENAVLRRLHESQSEIVERTELYSLADTSLKNNCCFKIFGTLCRMPSVLYSSRGPSVARDMLKYLSLFQLATSNISPASPLFYCHRQDSLEYIFH